MVGEVVDRRATAFRLTPILPYSGSWGEAPVIISKYYGKFQHRRESCTPRKWQLGVGWKKGGKVRSVKKNLTSSEKYRKCVLKLSKNKKEEKCSEPKNVCPWWDLNLRPRD